jgi:hypothetical protein
MTAQGIALGKRRGIKTPWETKTTPNRGALKGRNIGGLHASIASGERDPTRGILQLVRPFQGTGVYVFGPQGVALG